MANCKVHASALIDRACRRLRTPAFAIDHHIFHWSALASLGEGVEEIANHPVNKALFGIQATVLTTLPDGSDVVIP